MDLRSYTQTPVNMDDYNSQSHNNNNSTQFFSSNYNSSRIAPPYSPGMLNTNGYNGSPFGNSNTASSTNGSFNKAVQAPPRFLAPQAPGTPSKSNSSLLSPSFNVNNAWMESQHTGNSTTSDYNPLNNSLHNGNYSGVLGSLKNEVGTHDQFESFDKKLHSNNTGNSSNLLNDNIVSSLSSMPPPANHSLLDSNFSNNNHSVSSLTGKKEDAKNNDEEVIPTAIVIKNIPFSIKKEQLLEEMVKMNLPLPYAFNYHFDNGVFRGLAFANFTSHEETAIVVNNLHYKEISGRKLRVEYKKMLPLMERERIEREKREKRGQLEEQHKSASALSLALNMNNNNSVNQFTVHDLSPDNNNNKRFYASFPSTNIPLPSQLDFNSSEVLELYSTLLLFKYDTSSNRSEEIAYPLTISNIHKKKLTLICLVLDLQESFENNLIVVKRKTISYPHFTIQPPLMAINSSRSAAIGNSSPLQPPSAGSTTGQSFLNMSPIMSMHMGSPTINSIPKSSGSTNNNRTYNNAGNNIVSPIPPPSFSSSFGNYYGGGSSSGNTSSNIKSNSPQIASPTTYMMANSANSTSALPQPSTPNGPISSSSAVTTNKNNNNNNNLLSTFNPPSTSFHHPHHNLHNHNYNNTTSGNGLYSSLNNSNPNFGSSVNNIGTNNGSANTNLMLANLTQNLTGGDTFTPTTTTTSVNTPTKSKPQGNIASNNGNGISNGTTVGSGNNGSSGTNGLLNGFNESMGNLNLGLHHGNGSNISASGSNTTNTGGNSNTRSIWGSGRFM